jgi:hypothetical protein
MDLDQAERVRSRACDGKTRFSSSRSAHRALDRVRGRLTDRGRPLACYRCPFCSSWHLGRLLSEEGMQTIADAIRVIHQGVVLLDRPPLPDLASSTAV